MRKLAALLCFLAVVVAPSTSASAAVLGFQSEESPTSRIARDAPGSTLVGVDGLNLTGQPGAVRAGRGPRRQLAASHAAGLPAALLVGNYSSAINDFSEPLAYKTLASPPRSGRPGAHARRRRPLGGLGSGSRSTSSRFTRATPPGLVTLLPTLRGDLGPSASLTVCVANRPRPSSIAANGYDLAGIAQSVEPGRADGLRPARPVGERRRAGRRDAWVTRGPAGA